MLDRAIAIGMAIAFVLSGSGALGDDGKRDVQRETWEDRPSMELLEFLGEWETEEGEWIDPLTLEGMELSGEELEYDE